jgi:hypothetical protein
LPEKLRWSGEDGYVEADPVVGRMSMVRRKTGGGGR